MENSQQLTNLEKDKGDNLNIQFQQIEQIKNCAALFLTGYIDTYNSNTFQKRIGTLISEGYTKIIFHCGNLNYVSSTGIGSFTAFLKTVKPLGGDIVLIEIQPKVYEVFQLLGFSQFFNIKSNLPEAIQFFEEKSKETAQPETLFPKVMQCPVCSKKFKVSKAGRFRCSECQTILSIDNESHITIG